MDTRKNRQKWIEALRSGDYKQGQYALNKSNRWFCCLGVACDLFKKETGRGDWTSHLNGVKAFSIDNLSSVDYMPIDVMDWYGLDATGDLVRANDYYNKTFSEIADMIEEID